MRALLISLALLLCACATRPSAPDSARLIVITVADRGGPPMPSRGFHRPGYRISQTAENALAGLERDYDLTRVDGWPIDVLNVYCAVLAVAPSRDRSATLAHISADPRVQLSQPLQTFTVHGGYNDPYFDVQFGAASAQLLRMHRHATGRGVHIAVIDTGVDRNHPDLAQRIDSARNFVDFDPRFDSDIHGTAVAGIIAANADNGVGIVGVAPAANLLALKACWQDADDDIRAQCSTFTLAKALTFAIEQHVDIINMSLGGPDDPLLALLVHLALARGTVVVAAQNAPDDFPADVAGVIGVRTVDRDATAFAAERVSPDSVAVTSGEMLSTSPGGNYGYFAGSSMAAARVAGLSALLRQEHSQQSAAQLRDELGQRLMALGISDTATLPAGAVARH
jgi:subtilisin family serine protease